MPMLAGIELPPDRWLRQVRITFGAIMRACGPDDAEAFYRTVEPDLAALRQRGAPKLAAAAVDLDGDMLEQLEASVPAPAEGVSVPRAADGPLAEPPPGTADDPDPGPAAYLFRGRRHPLARWLALWEEAMGRFAPEVLVGTFFDQAHREARAQIREDVRFDAAVLARLKAAERVADERCGGAIRRGKAEARRQGGELLDGRRHTLPRRKA